MKKLFFILLLPFNAFCGDWFSDKSLNAAIYYTSDGGKVVYYPLTKNAEFVNRNNVTFSCRNVDFSDGSFNCVNVYNGDLNIPMKNLQDISNYIRNGYVRVKSKEEKEFLLFGDFVNVKCALANGSTGHTYDYEHQFDKMNFAIQGNQLTTGLYSGIFTLIMVDNERGVYQQVWNNSEIATLSFHFNSNKLIYSTNGASIANTRLCIADIDILSTN